MRVRDLMCVCLLWLPLSIAHAFYQWRGDDSNSLEVIGFVHGFGFAINNPNDSELFSDDEVFTGGLLGRLMLSADTADWQVELHAVQQYVDSDIRSGGSRFRSVIDVERSDALHWRFATHKADLVIDRLNFQYSSSNANIKIGRQAINLATTFYFTPNDFFAPFAAQTFFRTYKAGVDAARIDWQWNTLSQVSLITVLGYDIDRESDTGWSDSIDWGETAYLARVSALLNSFDWGLLLGKVAGDEIIGVDFQGEIFDWLGIRGEGHVRFMDDGTQRKHDGLFSLGFEHRWPSSLTLRLEHFYHHFGQETLQDDRFVSSTNNTIFYHAKNYSALGANYEVTPLVIVDAVGLFNYQDQSRLLALYSTYSLSNESELSIGLTIPMGDPPQNGRLKSEFGGYPHSISAEYRLYF